MKLSVIIPVYNVAGTLDRCLESVTRQDYKNMEIILVDDGSTDASGSICEEWAADYTNITVVHKKNGGLSDARNAGIEIANGDLITFVDSDDFIASGTFISVIKEMCDNTDVIEYGVMLFYGSDKERKLSFDNCVYTDMTEYWLECQGYAHTYACNKIYRKYVFNETRFPIGKVFEDAHTMSLILHNIQVIQTTNKGMYFYCFNNKGITATAGADEICSLLVAHIDNWDVTADDKYLMHVVNLQVDVYLLDGRKPLLGKCRIKNIKRLSRNDRVKAILLNIIGVYGLCRIYRLLSWLLHR